MSEHNTIASYLSAVSEQIQWKRARPFVISELEQHLQDQRDAFAEEGLEHAEALAVEEMGDPISVGTALNQIHRPKPQWGLLTLTMLLALTGAIFRVWLTADWASDLLNIDPFKTVLTFVLGCGALLLGYFLDYNRLAQHIGKIYIGILLVSVFAILFSPNINNVPYYARFVALYYSLVYALWLYECRGKGWFGFCSAMLGGIPLTFFCTLIPYTLGLAILLLTGFLLLLTAAWNDWFGLGRWHTMTPLLGGLTLMLGIIIHGVVSQHWRWNRLSTALHPESDPFGGGYQGVVIQKTLTVSQWLGEGTWSSEIFPYSYQRTVPGCDTDTFLTTVIYKLGWLPFLVIVLTFAALMLWLSFRCMRQKNQLGRMIVIAVVMSLSIQGVASVAWNMGFTFLSASFPLIIGNLNTVLNMALIGLALSVFRGDSIPEYVTQTEPPSPRFRIKLVIEPWEDDEDEAEE